MHTNDTHSHFQEFDLPRFGKDLGGSARRKAFIDQVRRHDPQTLVLDAGDLFQGTRFYSFFKGELDILACNLCGYDAVALGNHDLDDGMPNLLTQLQLASFPMLCANILDENSRQPIFPPSIILERHGLKIGLIGCIGDPAWEVIALKHRRGLVNAGHLAAVASAARDLRDRVDLLVLLSHAGYEKDLEMAKNLNELDLIIGGHTNTYLETPTLVKHTPTLVAHPSKNLIGGTLVVQAFKWGIYCGRLDLAFNARRELLAYHGRLEMMNDAIPVATDSPMLRLIDTYEARIKDATSEIIAECREDITYPEEDKHKKSLPMGVLVIDLFREFTGADVGILNSGGIRDGLSRGKVAISDVFAMLPFDNTLVTYSIKGRHLLEMLQYICDHRGKITGFQFGGLTFTMLASTKTVTDVRVNGAPLDPEKEYRLVTVSYLSDGNQGGTILFQNAFNKKDNEYYARDVAIEILRKRRVVTPPDAGGIKYLP